MTASGVTVRSGLLTCVTPSTSTWHLDSPRWTSTRTSKRIGRSGAGWSKPPPGGSRALGARSGDDISETVGCTSARRPTSPRCRPAYHDPSLERYLNGLVARAHGAIYGAAPRPVDRSLRFFVTRYRAVFRRTLPSSSSSGALMAVVMLATDLWVASSREAQAGLLPSAARQAMRDAGRGAGPSDGSGPAALSALIFQNNVQVAFLAFALGITFGIGTIWVITTNAVFIGLLAGGFQAAGKGWTFWSLVLPHGFLELTAICIAGGAGLRDGVGDDRPGRSAARDGARARRLATPCC